MGLTAQIFTIEKLASSGDSSTNYCRENLQIHEIHGQRI